MSQIDDIGAVMLALADNEEATAAFKRALGWHKKWDEDHVTIPRAQHEARMVAAKAIPLAWEQLCLNPRWATIAEAVAVDAIDKALATLRAAGIETEG